MMVSHTDHVRKVWTTDRLRQSFTIQKPPSFRWERNSEPQPMEMTANSLLTPGCAISTGAISADAAVMETVAEPVATRIKAETSQQ